MPLIVAASGQIRQHSQSPPSLRRFPSVLRPIALKPNNVNGCPQTEPMPCQSESYVPRTQRPHGTMESSSTEQRSLSIEFSSPIHPHRLPLLSFHRPPVFIFALPTISTSRNSLHCVFVWIPTTLFRTDIARSSLYWISETLRIIELCGHQYHE